MYRINYQIYLERPAVISDYSGESNRRRSLDFIPGNVLLGITAGMLDRKKEEERFITIKDLVATERIMFGNAIAGSEHQAEIIPQGYYYPKGEKDLPTLKDDEDSGAAKLYEMYRDNDTLPEKMIFKPLKPGWFRMVNQIPFRVPVHKETFTHNSVNPDTQRPDTKTGGVFVYEALSAGQTFFGEIRFADKEDAGHFYQFFGGRREIKIGRSLSAEYGSAVLTLSDPEEFKINNIPEKTDLRLVLESDAILRDSNGLPSSLITAEAVAGYLNQAGFENIEVAEAADTHDYQKSQTISGFNGYWGQFRTMVPAVRMGSVFHLRITGARKNEAIQYLLQHGLGERRNEGYGRIAIDNSLFHLRNGSNEINIPGVSVPDPESASVKNWWEIEGLPENMADAVFQKQAAVIILKKVREIVAKRDKELKAAFEKFPRNTQLQELRNKALNATGVSEIQSYMNNKRDKKAHKEGQWNAKIEIPGLKVDLMRFFTEVISDRTKFYEFLELDRLPQYYHTSRFHLKAVILFITTFCGLIIKWRKNNG
ncbi:MAG: hypothetical protein AB7W47_17170 [Calditrichaceae bacterium]